MSTKELAETVETLMHTLMSRATGGGGDELEYVKWRAVLTREPRTADVIPAFVRTCRDLGAFWSFIKPKFSTYAERRDFLRAEFEPCLSKLDALDRSVVSPAAVATLEKLDSEHVRQEWEKAMARRIDDPDGAITIAKSLVESVCKHILHELHVVPDEKWDLPKLYREVAEKLNLAPTQHSEEAFKSILGGCNAVVNGLATLRNRLGDAHGKAQGAVRPQARHAELAVSLAGAMATFLVATWEAKIRITSTTLMTTPGKA